MSAQGRRPRPGAECREPPVPASGAYQVSMGPGCDRTGRPAVVAVADGRPQARHETFDDRR